MIRQGKILMIALTIVDAIIAALELSQGRIASAFWDLAFIAFAWFYSDG